MGGNGWRLLRKEAAFLKKEVKLQRSSRIRTKDCWFGNWVVSGGLGRCRDFLMEQLGGQKAVYYGVSK